MRRDRVLSDEERWKAGLPTVGEMLAVVTSQPDQRACGSGTPVSPTLTAERPTEPIPRFDAGTDFNGAQG